jgi:drug/metabolite transporter (DMT)-like permease
MPESQFSLGVWMAALAAIGFSFKAILIKLAYPYGVDAITLLALRMGFSLPVYVAVGWNEGRKGAVPPLTRREHWQLAGLGIAGYYGASYLDFLGLQYITAGLERVVLYAYPTLVVILSFFFFGRRIGKREAAALVLSYAGIGLAFFHDVQIGADRQQVILGGALVFGSALAYAVYLVGNGHLAAKLGAARFTALAMVWSAAAVLLQFALTRPLDALVLPWEVYGLALAMALFSTVLPTFMISAGIRHIGAQRVGLIGTIGPVATIFFGALLLDEPVSPVQLNGAALVIAGVVLVAYRRR